MSQVVSVIVGAGPIGSALARKLAADGHLVKLVTRSGSGPELPQVELATLDASDAAALTRASEGAAAIYNCASPAGYTKWAAEWPPLAAAMLRAATDTGAVLVTFSNLYGYGPVEGAMTRNTPMNPSDYKGEIRKRMWLEALAAHEAGHVRVTEARASDYLGPTTSAANGMLARYADATFRGRQALVFGDPDQPHSWSYVDDVVATLALLGQDERAWGSAWLVPANPPATIRQVLQQMHRHLDLREPKAASMPGWMLNAIGLVMPVLREVKGQLYQFDRPFVMDSSETTELLGLKPTPWQTVVEVTASAWKTRY